MTLMNLALLMRDENLVQKKTLGQIIHGLLLKMILDLIIMQPLIGINWIPTTLIAWKRNREMKKEATLMIEVETGVEGK